MPRRHYRTGFTLIELLIVVVLMTIIAATVLTGNNPAIHEQLRSVARVVAADVSYCQSLAITHNSTYQITFDAAGGLYYIEHTGAAGALDNLPQGTHSEASDPSTRKTTHLADMQGVGGMVRLYVIRTIAATPATVTTLEFGPFGETKRTQPTQIWLVAGAGDDQRFLPLTVNPITGLTTIADIQSTAP